MINRFRSKMYELLRKSEQVFKTDMVYLVKGGFWINGNQVISAVIAFLMALVFANLLPASAYGTYKYILSLYGILGTLSLSGLGTALTRAVAKGNEGEYVKSIRFNARWELLFLLVGVGGAVYYYLQSNYTLALGFLIIGIFSPIKDSADLYPAFLTGKKDFKKISIFNVLKTAITALWLSVTIYLTKNPIVIVLSYFFINSAMPCLISWWIIKTLKPNDKTDNETITLTKHTSLMGNVSSFADQIDNILIFHVLGPVSLAVYNFAQAIPDYLGGFLKNISSLALPKFSGARKEDVQKTLVEKSLKVFGFGALMAFIYIVCAPIFFHIFFPKYLASVIYSQVYSLLLIGSAVLPLTFLDSQMAIKEKYIINFTGSIVKILLLTFGVIYYGIWGAILGRLLAKVVNVSVAFYFSKRV